MSDKDKLTKELLLKMGTMLKIDKDKPITSIVSLLSKGDNYGN